jgi:hypothetical protein
VKTNKLLKEISTRAFLFLIILLIAVSCRKDNDNIDPIMPTPPNDPNAPAVFGDKPLNILSDYEKANNLNFPGNTILKSGTGLLGGAGHVIWEGASLIGKVVWEAYDYHHTESRFDSIDDQLTEMQAQITDLNNTMQSMSNSLNISFAEIETLIYTQDLISQIGHVQTAMDSALCSGLMWYPRTARLYQSDTNLYKTEMENLKEEAPDWARNIYINKDAENYMPSVIGQIQKNICPPLGDQGNNALNAYTRSLILLCQGKVTDSASAMNAYLLLESYFLTIINYQFQAATVYVNAANFIDTTGMLATEFWQAHMVKVIPREVAVFLENVDYLAVNLAEYRNKDRFIHDMKYANAGLAPDHMFFQVLARSQFVANLLYAACGVPYPVISGHIMVPSSYTNDGSEPGIPNALTVQIGAESVTSAGTKFKSMIPNTLWGSDKTCHPSNNWNLYRFNTAGPNTVWACTPQNIQVVAGSSTLPWPHSPDVEIMGTVTPLFYNPRDPTQTSTTRTDKCTFQFAYFSANWQWGYMLVSNTTHQNKLPDEFNANFYNNLMGSVEVSFQKYTYYEVDGVLYPSHHYKKFVESDQIGFSYPENTGILSASGVCMGRTYLTAYCVVDARYISVKTGSELPDGPIPNGNNAIEIWALYNGFIDNEKLPPADADPKIAITLGSNYIKDGNTYYHVDVNILNDAFNIDKAMFNFPTHFNSLVIEKNKSYTPSILYYYYVDEYWEPELKHINIELNHANQFIYTGLYNLPDAPRK